MTALSNCQYIRTVRRGELECLEIRHADFSADLLLQGAQLISFTPRNSSNWLWLSDQVQYRQGTSLRGGIPLCWPWFGNAAMNPEAVRQQITDIEQAPAHGFARVRDWQIDRIEEHPTRVTIGLSLADARHPCWQAALTVSATFCFSAGALQIRLTTHNTGTEAVTFSQALHSYFPTADIHRTEVRAADGCRYIDTLDNWREKKQQGPITFSAETDRIYYPQGPLRLSTPQQQLMLQTEGSHSAVVWNPWTEKGARLSQFGATDWQGMFCVETANALEDAVTLPAGSSHTLELLLTPG
ncbi:MAG: D-hexose-6-phosphate mutarotase [Pseudomonadota bacterium]|nr:D-hexose-6-phosphate mutarotase [Pseudomonadota bacterium]